MPVSAGDLTKFRNSLSHVINPTINIIPPDVVATAQIATSPSAYPIGQVSVTGTSVNWSDIEVGHLYRITDGSGNLITTGVVRKTPTASILYIDGKAQGDSGTAVQTSYIIEAGQTVTVYDIKPMWTLLSRIKDGVFFKKFDVPYDGSGSNPAPVVNMGGHKSVWAGSNASYSITLDGSECFAWRSRTISSYTWSFPVSAGYSITSGTVNDVSLTVSFDQGYHRVKLTIVDSAGTSASSIRHIWVNGDSYDDLSRQFAVEIGSDSQNRQAENMAMSIHGDFDPDTFIEGSMIVVGINPTYDGDTVDTEYLHDTFVGFIGDLDLTLDAGVTGGKSVSFEAKSPYTWLNEIPMVSQVIVEVASPSSWEEVVTGLGTVDFLVWYIINHHTTFFEQFGYIPTGDGANSPRKIAWGLNGSSVAQYLEEISSFIGGNIGCLSDGNLILQRDPNIESTSYRDAIDNVITWTPDDIAEEPDVSYAYLKNVSSVSVYALERSASSEEATPFGSIAPGFQQGQASGSEQYDSFVLKPGENQTRVNELSGHLYAKANPKIGGIGLNIIRNMDVFEPALMVWHTVDIPAEYSARNERIFYRCLVESVTRNWEMLDFGTWVVNISVTLVPETFGQPGIKIPINQGGANGYTPASSAVSPSSFYADTGSGVMKRYTSGGFALATDNEGNIAMTRNGTGWEDISGSANSFQYVTIDWNATRSTLIANGWANGKLGAWAVGITNPDTETGTDIVIYYAPDILAPTAPLWLPQHTQSFTNPVKVHITSSKVNTDEVLVVVNDSRGTYAIATNDAGSNWSGFRVGIEQDLTGTVAEGAKIACLASELDGHYATFGWDGSGYELYVSTTDLTDSGDWTKAVNPSYGFKRPANWMGYGEANELHFTVFDNQVTNPTNDSYRIPTTYGFVFSATTSSDFHTFNDFDDDTTLTITGIAPVTIGSGFVASSIGVSDTDEGGGGVGNSMPFFTAGDKSYGTLVEGTASLVVSDGAGGTDTAHSTWSWYWDNAGLLHGDTYEAGVNIDFRNQPTVITEVSYRFAYLDPDWSNAGFTNVATTHRIELQDLAGNTLDYYEVTYPGSGISSPTAGTISTANGTSSVVTKSVDWLSNPVRGVRRVVIYITSTGDGSGFFPRIALVTTNSQIGASLGDTAYYKMSDYPLLIKGEITQGDVTIPFQTADDLPNVLPRGVEGFYNADGTTKDVTGNLVTVKYGIDSAGTSGVRIETSYTSFFNDDAEGNLQAYYEVPNYLIESLDWNSITAKVAESGYVYANLCATSGGTAFISEPEAFRVTGGSSHWFDINFANDVSFGELYNVNWAILNDASCVGWSNSDFTVTVALYDVDDNLLDSIEYTIDFDSSYVAYQTKLATPSDTRIISNASNDWRTASLRTRRVRVTWTNTASNSLLLDSMNFSAFMYETSDDYDVPLMYRVTNYDIASSETSVEVSPVINFTNDYTQNSKISGTNPFTASVDSTNRQRVRGIMTDIAMNEYWYAQSSDNASSWSVSNLRTLTTQGVLSDPNVDLNAVRGIIQAGQVGFIWGQNVMAYFVDGQIINAQDMRGNWSTKISSTTTEWLQMLVIV